MFRLFFQTISLFLLLTGILAAAPQEANSCAALLPESIRAAIEKRFPGHRVAITSDYLPEDLEMFKKDHPGESCPGFASADANGDGVADYAFFLSNPSNHTILVSALSAKRHSWAISQIYDYGETGIGRLYVEPLKRGNFRDMFDLNESPSEYQPEPGRVRKLRAKHPGFCAGIFESSAVAYFFTGKRWVHLWLSD